MKNDYLDKLEKAIDDLEKLDFKSRVDKQLVKKQVKTLKTLIACYKEELEDAESGRN